MLQLKTINKDTLDLLKELSLKSEISEFYLAGGTALALQIGHRVSVDLDFFTSDEFDSTALLENVENRFVTDNSSVAANSLSLFIKSYESYIKVDFIRHGYPILSPAITTGDIRLCSLEDIAAMKMNAVANRGAKKDFFDIYALLAQFSLKEMITFFEEKYRKRNSFTVTKSLAYFDDADMDPDPISLIAASWEEIKACIKLKLRESF